MTDPKELFHEIAKEIPEAIEGKMFGALCIKSKNGKAAAIFWKNDMLFKLGEKDQEEALKLSGSSIGFHLYAPEKQMKGWVFVPEKHSGKWINFTKKAIKYVKGLEK